MLGHIGVGAREQEAEGGELRVGGPHLLARQPPAAVVLPLGAGLDAGQVGAGRGLGEQLTPDLVGVEHGGQVALLLLLGSVGDDRGAEHADADGVENPRNARRVDLLVDDHLLQRAQALPAVLGRPGDTGEARLGQLALPGAVRGDRLVLVLDRVLAAQDGGFVAVFPKPGANLRAVLGLLRGVVQVHGRFLLADWPINGTDEP